MVSRDVDEERPTLKLTFLGEGFRDGAVPLSVVAAKLQSLQQAMFHAAASVVGHSGSRRGQWSNRYRPYAELNFASAHHSNLVIEAELGVDPSERENFDIGLQAVDLLFDVAAAVDRGSPSKLALRRDELDLLCRSMEGMMPNVGDQYVVRLENCRANAHPPVEFSSESRQKIRAIAKPTAKAPAFEPEEVTLVGELITIRVNAGENKVTIRANRREIDCFYSDALRDQVANLIAGSIVEVSGLATLDERGEVSRIHEVIDVSLASVEPIRVARFESQGRVFRLREAVTVDVEYTDGMWLYHHESLNLWGYAARREDALNELHENFAYQFREIAEESEENLDQVAKDLRRRLLDAVASNSGGSQDA